MWLYETGPCSCLGGKSAVGQGSFRAVPVRALSGLAALASGSASVAWVGGVFPGISPHSTAGQDLESRSLGLALGQISVLAVVLRELHD